MANSDAVDLMSIGAHCSVGACRQRDFLPFRCAACGDTFCLEHRTHAAHACPKAPDAPENRAVVCPLCARAILLPPGQGADEAFEEHARSGACDPSNYARVHRKQRCPMGGCRERLTTLNGYRCKRCGTVVCMAHRLAEDHACHGRIAEAGKTVGNGWSRIRMAQASTSEAQHISKPRAAGTSSKQRSQLPSMPPQAMGVSSHQSRVGQLRGKREACLHCGARFSEPMQLTQHVRDYHPSRDAMHGGDVCPRCGQKFNDVGALVQHAERGCTQPNKPVYAQA